MLIYLLLSSIFIRRSTFNSEKTFGLDRFGGGASPRAAGAEVHGPSAPLGAALHPPAHVHRRGGGSLFSK